MRTTHRRSVEDVPIPVVVVSADRTVSYANPAAHRMLGYESGRLCGKTLSDLTSPAWRAQLDQLSELMVDPMPLRLRSQAVRADGRVMDVCMTFEPSVNEHAEVVSVVVSYEPLPPWKANTPIPPRLSPASRGE